MEQLLDGFNILEGAAPNILELCETIQQLQSKNSGSAQSVSWDSTYLHKSACFLMSWLHRKCSSFSFFLESVRRKLENAAHWVGKNYVFPNRQKSYPFQWWVLISCFHKCYHCLKSSGFYSLSQDSFPACSFFLRFGRFCTCAHMCTHTQIQTHTIFPPRVTSQWLLKLCIQWAVKLNLLDEFLG